MASFSMKASGNIAPSRFVKQTVTADGEVTQAGTGERIFGVSHEGVRRIPGLLDDGFAAIAGEDLKVYGDNDECLLEIVATVAPGDRLKSDTDGKGTPVASNNDEWGATAKVAGVSGRLIRVEVRPGQQFGV